MKARLAIGGCLILAVVVAGLWVSTERATAAPPYTKLQDYYTDATYTDYVGACFRFCSGNRVCEPGTQETPYIVTEFDYYCSGRDYCCIRCSTGPCPPNVLANYPCPVC